MERLRCLLVAGALAAAVGVVAAGPAGAAKGGNNDTAKACQHGGWTGLLPDAGGVFANQGDCVNDGAQGSPPLGSAGQSACQQIGGRFTQKGSRWVCQYTPTESPSFPPGDANTLALQSACDTDGGRFIATENTQGPPGTWLAECN
jgi:hypothetical protein